MTTSNQKSADVVKLYLSLISSYCHTHDAGKSILKMTDSRSFKCIGLLKDFKLRIADTKTVENSIKSQFRKRNRGLRSDSGDTANISREVLGDVLQ